MGMKPNSHSLRPTPEQMAELTSLVRSTRAPAGLVRRAQIVLALSDGESYTSISSRLGVPPSAITRWKKRYPEQGIAGLQDVPRSGRPKQISPAREAKIIAETQKPPPKPFTHWSAPRMARRTGVSTSTVQRIWRKAGLKPHRLGHYKASPDPAFEEKAAAIIGLYLNQAGQPAHVLRRNTCRGRAGRDDSWRCPPTEKELPQSAFLGAPHLPVLIAAIRRDAGLSRTHPVCNGNSQQMRGHTE